MTVTLGAAPPAPAATPTRSALSLTRCPAVPTASALAYQLGYLQEEFADEPDFDVTFKSIGFTGKLSYAHHERLWVRNAGHAPAVWARAHGVDNRIVALAWLEGSYPLKVLAASGIATPADLKGRRVGIIGRAEQAFDLMIAQQLKLFSAALATAGLSLADVQRVDLPAPPHSTEPGPDGLRRDYFREQAAVLAEALRTGQVDAVFARLPADVEAELGIRTVYESRDNPDPLARVHPSVLRGLAVSGALLDERRDIVVRYLARLLQATEWALAHPDETVTLIARDFNVAPETLAGAYDSVAQGVQIDLDADKVASLRVQKDFLLEHGFIPQDFDIGPWVDPAPLAEARLLLADWKAAGKV